MLGKALKWGADVVWFLDDDVEWKAEDLPKFFGIQGDVVACTYRFKKAQEQYMGALETTDDDGSVQGRSDGSILMHCVPAGFLRVSRDMIEAFMDAYPDLMITADGNRNVDLFNHGAHGGIWYGEDYAFSRRCREMKVPIWCVPDMDVDHHGKDEVFKGNLHRFLLKK